MIFVPIIRYNQAATLASDGKYIEAYDAFVALGEYRDSEEKALSIFALSELELIKSANIGDYVFFGSYEQDNSVSNGKERIEWLVVDIQEGKALLLSKYALDCQPIHTGDNYRTWKTCTLFEWLNNEFLNAAFLDSEQRHLVKYDGAKVSLLDFSDATTYFKKKTSQHSENELLCRPTTYAIANGVWMVDDTDYCTWALIPESKGSGEKTFWEVSYSGSISGSVCTGGDYPSFKPAVRPAIWVDLSE